MEDCTILKVSICGKNREKFLELKSFEVRNGKRVSNELIVNKLISLLPASVLNDYISGKK